MSTIKRPHLLDLITDPGNGRLSHTRVLSLAGGIAAIAMFVCPNWLGTQSAEVWAMFLAGINGHAVYSKYLSLKFAAAPKAQPKDDE